MSVKKILLSFTFLCFVILFFYTPTYAEQAMIKTNHLNVRSGPGTEYARIAQVHAGEVYPITQKENNWVKIELADGAGWVSLDYVSITKSSSEESDSTTEESLDSNTIVNEIIIKNDQTHVRNKPSREAEIIGFVEKGAVLQVISMNNNWYEVAFEDQQGYIYRPLVDEEISLANNFKNKTVILDAGHGGRDIGAIGASGTYEKNFAMTTTNYLGDTLSLLGAEVILTRKNDDYIRLGSRPVVANIEDADAFLSIHYNSFPEMSSVKGIGTYYYTDFSRTLAKHLQQGLIEQTGAIDRDISHGNYLVLRQSFKPSALLELGFISNSEEEEILGNHHYQTSLTRGIVSGLATYLINPLQTN